MILNCVFISIKFRLEKKKIYEKKNILVINFRVKIVPSLSSVVNKKRFQFYDKQKN